MSATTKRFHDVIPRLRLGIDFSLAEAPGVNDGKRFIVFTKCPQCGKRIEPRRGFMLMVYEHPAIDGEVSYILHVPCGRALGEGGPDRGTSFAVLGALAALKEAFDPESFLPDVIDLDGASTLAPGSGRLQ